MEKHPEIDWSEVTRQAIRKKITKLELMDELAAEINGAARNRLNEERTRPSE